MAYLCPVCEDPQVDAEHLANHLAFTAMLEGDDHERWLDEHAPAWDEGDDEALAATLRERLESVEHPIDETEGHDHSHGQDPGVDAEAMAQRGPNALDGKAADVLAEARELTERMQENADEPETD